MKDFIAKLPNLSRRSWLIILLVTIFLIFYNVAEDVQDKETLSTVDPVVGQWLVLHVSPLDKTFANDITLMGSLNIMKIGILIFATFAFFKRQWLSAGILVVSLLSGLFLSALLKGFFRRARPSFFGTATQISGYSFPSNHSMAAVIFYGMIAYLLTSMITNRTVRIWVWVIMSTLFVAIGLSRMILGVHYMTDVLGGWLAGGTWLLVCIMVSDALKEILEKLLPKFYQKFQNRA